MENWLPVPGYEGVYEVSDQGRVRSLNRIDGLGRRQRGLVLKLRSDRDGYQQFHTGGSPRRQLRAHRVVLLAFAGPPPEGSSEALHTDGDPTNNALTNLRWGTSSENKVDSVLHGTHKNTAKTHCPLNHPYDEANTYWTREGWRVCRACRLSDQKARRALENQTKAA